MDFFDSWHGSGMLILVSAFFFFLRFEMKVASTKDNRAGEVCMVRSLHIWWHGIVVLLAV